MSTVTAPAETAQLPAAIVGKFNIALTQSGYQKIADSEKELVYNEDNLESIKEFLKNLRKVGKAIDETHQDGKAEALKIGRDWDKAKNTFKEPLILIEDRVQGKYAKICQDIETKRQEAARETQRIATIKQGIESNAINFAKQIAECTTSVQLTNIERLINLEKGRKEKYQEFLTEAANRFTELNSLLSTQKETVRELEENKKQQEIAKKANDDAALLLLQQKQEATESKIEEAKVIVQETAINQSMQQETPVAATIFPTVNARRTIWKFEMVNEKEVMNKAPELLVVSLDDEKVKQTLKTLKDTNQLDGKTELVLNGIRYYEQKTF